MKIYLFILISFFLSLQSIAQTYQWTKTNGSEQYDELVSLISDDQGNIYSTGAFMGTVDFDPGPNVFNLSAEGGLSDYNIFVQKLDPQGNFIWVKSISGIKYDDGKSIMIDSSGNLIITGRTDIPGADFVGDQIIVFKLDSHGNTIFSKVFGGDSQDFGSSVVVDGKDNIYLIGQYNGTVDFDPGVGVFNLTSKGSDVFIQKLDSNGEFVWVKSVGGSELDFGRNLNIDSQGNLYITGFFSGTSDFDPGDGISIMTSIGAEDAFVLKLNNNGELIWHKSFGSSGIDDAWSSAIDNDGNIIITGHFTESVDFDPNDGVYNLVSNGEDDVFIQKLNNDGEFVWANSLGTIYSDIGQSVDIDASNEIYVTGGLFNTIGYNPNDIIPIANYDIFIHKYSSEGDLLWEKIIGGSDSDEGRVIHVDDFFNIYVGGHFHETVDFNPDETNVDVFISNGYADHFITKYSQENEDPIAYPVDELIGCDDNQDGYSEYFDTSDIQNVVLGSQTGMVVTYYDENNNQLPSPLPNPFINTISNTQNLTIRVTDPVSLLYDETILTLQIISAPNINQPQDLFACDLGSGFSNFDTSNVQNEIIGAQTGLQIRYFDQSGIELPSPLPNSFLNTVSYRQTISARVENSINPICYSDTSFDLIINSLPDIYLDEEYYICNSEPSITLAVSPNFYSYEWSFEDGALLSSAYNVEISNEGNYMLTVTQLENGVICEKSFSFSLIRSVQPVIEKVNYGELGNNFIEIIISDNGDFEYSIDGENYQDSNYFDNIPGGGYTVYARDKDFCGEDSKKLTIIDYPKFFTPNNDGYNDYWQIKGADNFLNSKIFIFDRYGKLLKQLSATSSLGWNGFYNGKKMPSDDYWFSADLGNGKVFSGHFALKF